MEELGKRLSPIDVFSQDDRWISQNFDCCPESRILEQIKTRNTLLALSKVYLGAALM
ncbi:hypothetical protein [Vibrio penaeicida]|uniref:Uncharacterized protein n=1 Tax=Vibrio penaeicida TaxID=104609 RepID=A0AAV5NT53_9VIBR|nr:hypothetical protein [Vibrio penaeicida]GLQ73896.1 hypothetical protein GCM10007932_32560 [Vibrio penaeicida]